MARMPIPGYDGYHIDPDTGYVYNAEGHQLKPIQSKQGLRVELRKPGLRDRFLVSELIELVKGVQHEDG